MIKCSLIWMGTETLNQKVFKELLKQFKVVDLAKKRNLQEHIEKNEKNSLFGIMCDDKASLEEIVKTGILSHESVLQKKVIIFNENKQEIFSQHIFAITDNIYDALKFINFLGFPENKSKYYNEEKIKEKYITTQQFFENLGAINVDGENYTKIYKPEPEIVQTNEEATFNDYFIQYEEQFDKKKNITFIKQQEVPNQKQNEDKIKEAPYYGIWFDQNVEGNDHIIQKMQKQHKIFFIKKIGNPKDFFLFMQKNQQMIDILIFANNTARFVLNMNLSEQLDACFQELRDMDVSAFPYEYIRNYAVFCSNVPLTYSILSSVGMQNEIKSFNSGTQLVDHVVQLIKDA